MKQFLILLFTFFILCASGLDWCSSYRSARKKAAGNNKKLLIFFSGSDWCHGSEASIRQYFTTADFKKMAAEKLVLYNADLPKYKKLGQEAEEYNRRLTHRYSILAFPAIVVIEPRGGGMLLKQVGGGGKELAVFNEKLKTILYGKKKK